MAKKNKKEYKEQVSVQVNEVVESELIQIELDEISEEKLMMNEDISQEDETPAIEPMPEIIEEIQEEPCTCIGVIEPLPRRDRYETNPVGYGHVL